MYKVMIVDDMEFTILELKRLKIWGEVSGFQIIAEAKNGREALEKLQTSPVDLIITDIRMPVVDGLELLEKVKTEKLASCVVFMSEYTEFEYARRGLVLGAFDYIVKPIHKNNLLNLLERAKQFLTQKKEEEERSHIYKSSIDIKQIIKSIENRDNFVDLAAIAFDKIANEEGELIKIQISIQRLLNEIIKTITYDFPQFKKFIDISNCENCDFFKITSVGELKVIFISHIQQLFNLINNLILSNNYGSTVMKISDYVLENVDSVINLSLIAEDLHMHKNYISEIFKQKTGISLLEYVTKVKMERAKVLLFHSELKSYEVADRLAYNNSEYFSKLFKKYIGMSPTEYRNSKILQK